jgi:hypothetical protein
MVAGPIGESGKVVVSHEEEEAEHTRTCTVLKPEFGGLDCYGVATESGICGEKECPIGKYSFLMLINEP